MEVTLANQLTTHAIKEETERQEHLLRQAKDAQSKSAAAAQAATEHFLPSWRSNCETIAADPRARSFFRNPEE